MKKTITTTVLILLLSSVAAMAQNLELFGGYGYLGQGSSIGGRTHLNGWASGAEVGFSRFKYVSFAGTISGAYGSRDFLAGSEKLHQFTYMAGPRISQRTGRARIFEHVMFGGARLSGRLGNQSDSVSSIAFAIGAGTDLRLNKHFIFRPAQFDYVLTRFGGNNQNNVRYSSGFAYRF